MAIVEGRKKTALITGASGGIGYELAKQFAQGGYELVLVARSEGKLHQLAKLLKEQFGTKVMVLVSDLGDPSAPDEIYRQLEEKKITVDALVNNAGVGSYGFFSETDLKAELNLMQLNIVSLTHLTKLFIGGMIKRKSGEILNVSSTAAFQPGPLMAVYYASKAFVLSFSEALANEVEGQGIKVSALCPGPTESDFQKKAKVEKSKLFKSIRLMDSATVAQIGYDGLKSGKTVVIPGLTNRLVAQSHRLWPRKWITQMVRRIQSP